MDEASEFARYRGFSVIASPYVFFLFILFWVDVIWTTLVQMQFGCKYLLIYFCSQLGVEYIETSVMEKSNIQVNKL